MIFGDFVHCVSKMFSRFVIHAWSFSSITSSIKSLLHVYQIQKSCNSTSPFPPSISKYQNIKKLLRGISALPYFACHAKKYMSAAKGCPSKQKLIQKMTLPATCPFLPSQRFSVSVMAMRGTWMTMPTNAMPCNTVSQ